MTISCRPFLPSDEPFLNHLITCAVADELGAGTWPVPLRQQILNLQYTARRASQRARFPDSQDEIIEQNAVSCGWFATAEVQGELRLIDILISPERRGQGIGATIVNRIVERGVAKCLPVSLHVHTSNVGALRLYQRLGFVRVGGDETRHFMLRSAAS